MSSIYVEVMYSDRLPNGKFRQVRVPIGEASSLRRRNVIFVIVSFETAPERSRREIEGKHYERGLQAFGHDFTALLLRKGGTESTLVEWDQGVSWFRHNDPRGEYPVEYISLMEAEKKIVFVGKLLSTKDWEDAIEQFNREMH